MKGNTVQRHPFMQSFQTFVTGYTFCFFMEQNEEGLREDAIHLCHSREEQPARRMLGVSRDVLVMSNRRETSFLYPCPFPLAPLFYRELFFLALFSRSCIIVKLKFKKRRDRSSQYSTIYLAKYIKTYIIDMRP
jgi:hypothetical protein